MNDREKQIPPPRSWEVFENLCHQLFKAVWCDPLAQKVGRLGQAQQGVDIFGSPNSNYEIFQGVQCKAKEGQYGSNPSLAELQREIAKAEGFQPTLRHWIFATTAPVDATLQQKAREISAVRDREGRFTVSVLGWGEITNLLCQHKQVLSEFYPEYGFDVSQLLNYIQAMPHASEVRELLDIVRCMGTVHPPTHPRSIWRPVVFGDGRDLGPALMGRSLGPEDAAACPRLLEADAAVNELKQAYSARIVGEPGSGKSICAYQTALHFANNGWSVLRLTDPRVETIELEVPDVWQRAIFIIDDAHLTSRAALRVTEDAAGRRRLLSTHNAVKHDASSRGAIIIDTKRAVRTIASALRNEPERTLDIVRRIDNDVGHLPSDVSLEDRIVQAEQHAQFPWQFCFIVGGGWRRATSAAAAARSAHADITLAGIAIRQLASRDARPSLHEVTALLDIAGLSTAEVQASVQWLIHDRLVIGLHDVRCPHQRFALVVFRKVLEGQDNVGRERIGRLLQHIVADVDYPIAGLRLLLQELRFAGDTWPWTFLIPEASLEPLIERCWQASKPEERAFASLLLSEIGFYVEGWPRKQIEDRKHIIGRWISDPVEPSGYGLGWLIHAVRNKDRRFARVLAEASEPCALAAAISAVTSKTAYNLGEILSSLHVDPRTPWGSTFLETLDRSKLINFAANWPESEPTWAFTNFCHGMVFDEPLALDMIEGFIPTAQKLLSKDPISAFGDLSEIVMHVLRMVDDFGVYVGQLAPKSRHRALARKMFQRVKPAHLGEQLSSSRLRQFQNTSFLLAFMAQAAPAKFRATAATMDWMHIAETIGDQWRNLPHEAEVLFGVAYQAESCREKIERVIHDNLHRIEAFPPRLVLIAPNAAYRHAEQGGLIRLAHHDHVDWRFGVAAITCFAEESPNLLESILKPSEITTGRVFSNAHPSWYDEAADYVHLIK